MESEYQNVEQPSKVDESQLSMMEQMAELIPGGFFVYYAEGDQELIHINKAMLRIFSCDTVEEFKELTGNSFKGIVHPDDYERIEQSIREQIASRVHNLDYVEYRIIQKDGTVKWVEDYGYFMHTETYGNIFYVFIEDATERMQSRMQELERINIELNNAYEREQQYKKAILHDAVTFFEINLTKDEFITSATQVVNGECHDMFDVLGVKPFKKYSDFLKFRSREMQGEELEAYWQVFDINRLLECYKNGEYEVTNELRVVDKLGRQRFYRYTFLMGESEKNGDVIALSVAKDVTDDIERQKLLHIALSEAKSANVAKKTFLNSMSHDIRTPLNGIIGFMELMETHLEEPDTLIDYLQKMKLASAQLLEILTESMEYTRIESGRTTLVNSECNLLDLVEEVEKTIAPEAEAKKIYFKADKTKVQQSVIYADVVRVKEILNQLLDNAVKYTQEYGRVNLYVSQLQDAPKNHAAYQFVVEDTGIGIKSDSLERIFEPFERESDFTNSGIYGSGLGLAMVKSLVDMMSGTIEVTSTLGVGSTFTVTLAFPIVKESVKTPETVVCEPESYNLKGIKILLVEDNEINLEIATELLLEQGMIVETAEDGKAAVEKVKGCLADPYDIILMDIQMPVMDGYEATKQIRALDKAELSQIPIIAVSANTFAEDQEKSLGMGMNAHVPKPIDFNNLFTVMAKILLQHRTLY